MDEWNNRFLRKKILLLVTDLEVYGQKDFGTNLKTNLHQTGMCLCKFEGCTPTFTDQIFLQPFFASFTDNFFCDGYI